MKVKESLKKYDEKIIKISLILTLIIYFEPQMFKEDNFQILLSIDKVYKMLKIISFLIISIICFRNKNISKIFYAMVAFQIIAFISTFINRGSINRMIGPGLTTLVMIMSAEIFLKNEEKIDIIKILNYYFRTIFLINVFFIVLVDGFKIYSDEIYFLGIDNRWIFSYIPWMFFEMMYSIYENKYINSYISFALIEVTLIYRWTAAAFIINLLWLLPLILKDRIKLAKYTVPTYIATVVANLLIVVFKVQEYFTKLLSILKKDPSLSGRTFLWNGVFENTKSHPILGQGMQTIEYDKDFFGKTKNNELDFLKVSHAHNSYMTVLYRYGIMGLIAYIIPLLMSIINLQKNYKNKFANISFICITVCLLLGIFDTLDCSMFYFALGFAYSIKNTQQEEKNK